MNEALFRDLISGRARGLSATSARGGLRLLAPLYGLGMSARNRFFDLGWRTVHRADVPVLSIGNLTTGGTGKTPFAAFLADRFAEYGARVCFISRGYQASSDGLNDEALVLKQLCPQVPHLQDPDRVASARQAVDEFGAELLLLDDGFQHRRLHRDLNIVLIDALNPWGYGHLLPRGLLREPLSSLSRADVIVITRVNQISAEKLTEIRQRISQHAAITPVELSFPPTGLINASSETAPLDSLSGKRLALFCGIGNPSAFRASVDELGFTVEAFREFPDHYRYTTRDIDDLEEWLKNTNVDAVLVTQKDLVKLDQGSLANVPLWAVKIGCKITAGETELHTALKRVFEMCGPREDG